MSRHEQTQDIAYACLLNLSRSAHTDTRAKPQKDETTMPERPQPGPSAMWPGYDYRFLMCATEMRVQQANEGMPQWCSNSGDVLNTQRVPREHFLICR
eukprot:scaffold17265_cov74-Attheya_sp.AAC.1